MCYKRFTNDYSTLPTIACFQVLQSKFEITVNAIDCGNLYFVDMRLYYAWLLGTSKEIPINEN
jgi:hypothetical protein